jgi:hypothetical protein
MEKYGLKIIGADELETILPRRGDVIRPQAKRRVEHALHFIADKIRKSVSSHDSVIIIEAELTNTYRGTDMMPCRITDPNIQWYLRQAGYDFEFINNASSIMITWGKMIW